MTAHLKEEVPVLSDDFVTACLNEYIFTNVVSSFKDEENNMEGHFSNFSHKRKISCMEVNIKYEDYLIIRIFDMQMIQVLSKNDEKVEMFFQTDDNIYSMIPEKLCKYVVLMKYNNDQVEIRKYGERYAVKSSYTCFEKFTEHIEKTFLNLQGEQERFLREKIITCNALYVFKELQKIYEHAMKEKRTEVIEDKLSEMKLE